MKIAIFGATGKTGVEIVKQALAHGHEVTVLVRDPIRLPTFDKPIAILKGDLSNHEVVKKTVQGQEAVICALGARELYTNSGVRAKGTRAIIEAMTEVGIKRLVVMSSMGIGDSWHNLSWFTKLLFKLVMPAARQDHEDQEKAVQSSVLNWTIIRPSGLTDVLGITPYEYGKDLAPKTSRISRANVADLLLKVTESNSHVHEAITISN